MASVACANQQIIVASSQDRSLLAPYMPRASCTPARRDARTCGFFGIHGDRAATGQDDFGGSDHHPDQDASERGETVAAIAKAAVNRLRASDKEPIDRSTPNRL